MIPADLAARLRTLTEASFFNTEPPVPGLQRAREIQSQLPDLVPGQRFFATLQRALPDGSFRALVAGQQLTLALNTSAKAGDTLELEVTQTSPRAVFARVVAAEGRAAGTASAQPVLSQTGRLISFLLTGQPTPPPASLGASRPLLAAPPASGAQLAPLLRQALGQSGLFYESHQVQWVLGKLDAAALAREPQGQHAPPPAPPQAAARNPASAGAPPGTGAGGSPAAPASAPAAAPSPAAGSLANAASNTPTNAAANAATQAAGTERAAASVQTAANEAPAVRASPIPERLMPLVHQQLEALATQQYVLQGQAWPGQTVQWIIEDPQRDPQEGEEDAAPAWNSTLRLTLPRLGGIEAQLHLTPAGVAVRLRADEDQTLVALDAGAPALASALEAANLKLTGLIVEGGSETRQTAAAGHG